MTVFGKFILASVISFFCMVGALGSKHPVFLIALAMLCWVIFAWSVSSGNKRKQQNKKDFDEFMKFKKRGY